MGLPGASAAPDGEGLSGTSGFPRGRPRREARPTGSSELAEGRRTAGVLAGPGVSGPVLTTQHHTATLVSRPPLCPKKKKRSQAFQRRPGRQADGPAPAPAPTAGRREGTEEWGARPQPARRAACLAAPPPRGSLDSCLSSGVAVTRHRSPVSNPGSPGFPSSAGASGSVPGPRLCPRAVSEPFPRAVCLSPVRPCPARPPGIPSLRTAPCPASSQCGRSGPRPGSCRRLPGHPPVPLTRPLHVLHTTPCSHAPTLLPTAPRPRSPPLSAVLHPAPPCPPPQSVAPSKGSPHTPQTRRAAATLSVAFHELPFVPLCLRLLPDSRAGVASALPHLLRCAARGQEERRFPEGGGGSRASGGGLGSAWRARCCGRRRALGSRSPVWH